MVNANTGESDECYRPSCNSDQEETYRGPNGNSIRVCKECYYKLVTRRENTIVNSSITSSSTEDITSPNNSMFSIQKEADDEGIDPIEEMEK